MRSLLLSAWTEITPTDSSLHLMQSRYNVSFYTVPDAFPTASLLSFHLFTLMRKQKANHLQQHYYTLAMKVTLSLIMKYGLFDSSSVRDLSQHLEALRSCNNLYTMSTINTTT